MSRNFDDFEDIDEIQVSDSKLPEYKVKADTIDLIGFPLLHPKTGKAVFKRVKRFRHNDGERWHKFQAPTETEFLKEVIQEIGEPEERFVTVVIKYETDKQGNLKKPITGEILTILLSPTQMINLKKLSKVKSLSKNDLQVSSTNPDFQSKDFTPTNRAIWDLLKKDGKTPYLTKQDVLSADLEDEEDSDSSSPWTRDEVIEEAWQLADRGMDKIVADRYADRKIREVLGLEDELEHGSVTIDDELDSDLEVEIDDSEENKPY
ncbi:hypothetical protein ThvES_00013440 [Thiovulum sp. ES]|nr:hypothetical protein ThvES_00013440 [Thiovulum sp. ES]